MLRSWTIDMVCMYLTSNQTFMATVPLGRGSTPRDVANTCAFLCSDEADFLTGIDIPVDGGRVSAPIVKLFIVC